MGYPLVSILRYPLVSILRRDGIFVIPPMPRDKAFEITRYLEGCPVFNGHVPMKATLPATSYAEALRQRWPVFSVAMTDIVTAPYWFETALSWFLAARNYFVDEFPRLYSLNAFWTAPSDELFKETQSWHYDGDDAHQLDVFMFGTDVLEPEDGEHQFQVGTHRLHLFDDTNIKHILGPAGTMYVADNNGIHRGISPRAPRLLLWARWGALNPPHSYIWDGVKPVSKDVLGSRYPTDRILQEAIRLVVE